MARTNLILTCEHASPDVPRDVDLGVGPEDLRSHAAWDPGAADVARRLADRLATPLLEGSVSRLFVDLNRPEESCDVVPLVSFGLRVPGNAALAKRDREARIAGHHRPHWRRVRGAIENAARDGGRCLHVAVHSFVAELDGRRRDVEIGVLFDPSRPWERDVSERLVESLRGAGRDARPNEPYAGIDEGMTTSFRRRFPETVYAGIEIELSQALLAEEDGADAATDAIARALDDETRRPWPSIDRGAGTE